MVVVMMSGGRGGMVAFWGERGKRFETQDAALPMSFLFPCRGGAAGHQGVV